MKHYDIEVKDDSPERLDKFLFTALSAIEETKSYSRSLIRKLVDQGAVYLNRKRCKIASRPLQRGDKLRIFLPEQLAEEKNDFVLSENDILFEDEDLIVVNKPPFLPTHATIDDSRHNLVLAVQNFLATRTGIAAKDVYLGVHHRLDRDTSGVILFTKRKEANAKIAQAFQGREIQKTYLAVCMGKAQEKEFSIKNYLGPHPRSKRIFCSVHRNGKFAHTDVRLLEIISSSDLGPLSLVEARPLTGRTHQIRVHLSENRLPILGDETYGRPSAFTGRLLLHAWKLKLGEQNWQAPVPSDITKLGFKEPK